MPRGISSTSLWWWGVSGLNVVLPVVGGPLDATNLELAIANVAAMPRAAGRLKKSDDLEDTCDKGDPVPDFGEHGFSWSLNAKTRHESGRVHHRRRSPVSINVAD